MNESIHILLVDDEPLFAQSLQQILQANNYISTIANNGSEALNLLKTEIFDLILLDVDLPDMSGVQIIDSIKEHLPTTPVIMMTGNASVETAVEAMKKGAHDYLKKPIVYDLLTTSITMALRHYRLEKELNESEKRFKTLSEASWEGIIIHNQGLLIEANKQFFKMFGYPKEVLLGTNILEKIFTPVSYEKIVKRIKMGRIGSHEATGIRNDGHEFPLETRTSHIEFQGQRLRVCVVRDITDRKKAEEEKLQLQMQLAKANKMEALGLMAGSVAHDLNNILAGVVSFPEILLMELDQSSALRESIITIQDAGKRAASVVSDLITIARGATTLKTVKSPNTIITNHLSSIEHKDYLSKFPTISISTRLEAKVLNINCSEMHVNKLLMNLIGNAMEALDPHGSVIVATENVHLSESMIAYEKIAAGNYVKISVSDNGPGIPPKDLEHIFDPFYSKKIMGKSGTGLGLAIVWGTVHDHNGFIDVKSGYDGTTFELYIPSTTEEEFKDNSAISIGALRGNGEAILVVDDQETQCLITRNMLTNIGYRAASVNTGEDALRICKRNPVDLVILDMILEEGMNGRETYEEILKFNPEQKAIVISGFSESDELEKIQALGVSHFIRKPYTLDQIGIAVKQSLMSPTNNKL